MSTVPDYPSVSAAELDGWEQVDETVETLFQLPIVRVIGATREYDDVRTRRVVRETTDGTLDRQWRFFTATRLGFDPALPRRTSSVVRRMVDREARRTFEDRLGDYGIEELSAGSREQVRLSSDTRVRLTRYDGIDPIEGGIPVTGWVGVWTDDTGFLVVTGGYPRVRLADALAVDSADDHLSRRPEEYRDAFFSLVRAVT